MGLRGRYTTRNVYGLTATQMVVIKHVSKGLTSREIGDLMFVTESTVKSHLTNIYKHLRINRRGQLIGIYAKWKKNDLV